VSGGNNTAPKVTGELANVMLLTIIPSNSSIFNEGICHIMILLLLPYQTGLKIEKMFILYFVD
jgi:hypothetical protein